jgi:glycosyltransferase involved in cell wall biosynthesis
VRAAHPDVVVRIVGEAGDRIHRLAGDGVVVTGAVPDPGEAFSRAAALVVPLRYGSGSRLKIIEAWARGVPVVTTTIGAEGLGATDGVDVLVGDDPAGLAAACGRLLGDRGCGDALVAGGRRRYEEGHTEEVLDRHVDAVLDRVRAGCRAAR